MFHLSRQARNRRLAVTMRAPSRTGLVVLAVTSACRIGEHHAAPPVDGSSAAVIADAGLDGAADADENTFHGLHAAIGQRPEWTGTCKTLPDYPTMMTLFATPVQQQDVDAGWEFDTAADSYSDPSYGFDPSWPTAAPAERFSVRFRGTIHLAAGTHCFSIDIGATGTDIITGKNACGQVYAGDAQPPALAETGYEAKTSGPATGCIDVAADKNVELDIVFWYFNIFEQAKLLVRHCAGAACTPDQPLSVPDLAPL
jgi:hypothetical protein